MGSLIVTSPSWTCCSRASSSRIAVRSFLEAFREAGFRAEVDGDFVAEVSRRDAEGDAWTPARGALHPADGSVAACTSGGVELSASDASPPLDGAASDGEAE